MKKVLLFFVWLLLSACASLKYDNAKFWVDSDVKLSSISAYDTIRERDGQMLLQISGVSRKNQSVYYKVEWFDGSGVKISTSLSQWKRVNLHENVEFFWNAMAPSRRATNYKVYVTDNIGNGLIQ